MEDVKYERSYQIDFHECLQINITNSMFIENNTLNQLGSCLKIQVSYFN